MLGIAADALDRRITDTNSLGKTRSFGYDAVGNRVQTIDRNGRKISYGYDALDRQISENWLNGSNAIVRTFAYTYDAVGHLLTSIDPDSQYTYTYDLVDRIKSVDNTGTTGVPAVKFAYNYDAVGNLLSVADTIDGTQAGTNAYTYDLLNRVTQITQSGAGVQGKRVDMSYDAVNRLTGLNRYGDLAGISAVADSSYVYDTAGRLTNLTHKRGASTIASYGFAYDAANRITQKSGTDGIEDYSYDETNQLTGVDNSSRADEAYSYDANGNRTSAGYGTGGNNQLLTDGVYNYEYDDEGNRTRRTEIATGKVTEYVWDYRNRLTAVVFKDAAGNVTKTIDYIYDGNNQRIGKRIDGAVTERYVIDRNQIALVFDGAGNQTHRYLYGTAVDQVLADETGVSTNWFLADNQGTVKDVVDGNGSLIDHVVYDSFGKVESQSNAGYELRFGYTGREQDGETGLDYYRARYYDASNGRFISEDPIGFNAGDGNLTRYVGNSPVNFTDPDGNRGVPPVRVVPRNLPRNFPGTGTPRQPGINPYRPNVPGYTNYPNNNPTSPGGVVPSCVTLPGQTCNPQQFDPNVQLDRLREQISPNTCPANYPPKAQELIPWKDRATWPDRCQLQSQSPQPLLNRELCIYKCRDDGGWFVNAYRKLGEKCPQWANWFPDDRWLDPKPDNLPDARTR